MTAVLTLDDMHQVARGKQRAVFLHPSDDSKLIKVLRKTADLTGRSAFNLLTERWFPNLRLRNIRKEYLEYLRVMLSNPQPEFQPPVSHMYGFVSTNLGLGCVTEKVVGDNGGLADTLKTLLVEDRLTDKHLDLLNETIRRLFDLDIRASDLTARNFVFGHRLIGGYSETEECVVVDGFGDVHAVPVRSMAKWSNRLGLDDSCKRLAKNNKLHWDPRTRQISR